MKIKSVEVKTYNRRDNLFMEYKKLATDVGLLDKNGKFEYDDEQERELMRKIRLSGAEGDAAREFLTEKCERENAIYERMKVLECKLSNLRE